MMTLALIKTLVDSTNCTVFTFFSPGHVHITFFNTTFINFNFSELTRHVGHSRDAGLLTIRIVCRPAVICCTLRGHPLVPPEVAGQELKAGTSATEAIGSVHHHVGVVL